MIRFVARFDRELATVASRQNGALWASGRSIDEHVAYNLEQLERAGPELLQFTGLVDETGVLASIKRYGLALTRDDRTLPAIGIGAVFTRPDVRGRGLATKLLERVLLEAEREGFEAAFLYSDIAPTLYERLGFVALDSFDHAAAAHELPSASPLTLRVATDADTQAMLELYEASWIGARDAIRPARTLASWRYFRFRNRIAAEWLLEDAGKTCGYVIAAVPDALRDLPPRNEPTLWVDEWSAPGVDAARVLATLRSLAEHEGAARVETWLRPRSCELAGFSASARTDSVPMIRLFENAALVRPSSAFLGSFDHF